MGQPEPDEQREGQGERSHQGPGGPLLKNTKKKKIRRGGKGRFKDKPVFGSGTAESPIPHVIG